MAPKVEKKKSKKKMENKNMIPGNVYQAGNFYPINGIESIEPAFAPCWDQEIINPIELGFIPNGLWQPKLVSLKSLHEEYFSKKNNINRRFEQKLWNALQISTKVPQLAPYVGVSWLNCQIIRVEKVPFAFLLGIRTIDGSLFHKQGNFPRHGFVEIPSYDDELKDILKGNVIEENVKYLKQAEGLFTAMSNEESISRCKWVSPASTAVAPAPEF